MNPQNAMQTYQQITVHSGVEDASPHRLIQMLLEGALDNIAQAKGAMIQKNLEKKGKSISVALGIIEGLQGSLDFEKGGEVAQNLNQLYEYAMQKLLEANLNDEPSHLEEVAKLMATIKSGWDGIKE